MSHNAYTNCSKCNKIFKKGTKVCPACGLDQRGFLGKHKVKIGIVILVVVLGIGVISVKGGEPSNVKPEGPQVEDDVSAKDDDKVEGYKVFGMGESVVLDGNSFTVLGFDRYAGDEKSVPADDKEFMTMNVKLENKGSSDTKYDPSEFKMENSQGELVEVSKIILDKESALTEGVLKSGESIEGSITFEQPIDDLELKLIYEPNFWNDGLLVFDLNK